MALQTLISALRPAALYAMVGLGFVIVYLATGSINFAQGEFVALGGLTTATLLSLGMNVWVAIVLTLLGSLALGWVFDRALIQPLGKDSMVRTVMISIGASVLLRQIALHAFGPDEHTMPTLFARQVLVLGGGGKAALRVEVQTLVLVVALLAVLGIFLVVYYRTKFGASMRANEQSPEGAELVGVRPARVVNRSFML
ncbi:MAG: branched-chain amino acid ABC transporter permease, partial [Actinomycetes bacterium]|nr:branched-chain amino acid ABC transporter permease [Actinomycetes bacterium]